MSTETYVSVTSTDPLAPRFAGRLVGGWGPRLPLVVQDDDGDSVYTGPAVVVQGIAPGVYFGITEGGLVYVVQRVRRWVDQ